VGRSLDQYRLVPADATRSAEMSRLWTREIRDGADLGARIGASRDSGRYQIPGAKRRIHECRLSPFS
jgi:hypothetical protein